MVYYIIVQRTITKRQRASGTFWGKEEHMEDMTEKEQATLLIDEYTKLQRIKSATDREKEIEYQLKTTKAKLEALGIVTENLDIE